MSGVDALGNVVLRIIGQQWHVAGEMTTPADREPGRGVAAAGFGKMTLITGGFAGILGWHR